MGSIKLVEQLTTDTNTCYLSSCITPQDHITNLVRYCHLLLLIITLLHSPSVSCIILHRLVPTLMNHNRFTVICTTRHRFGFNGRRYWQLTGPALRFLAPQAEKNSANSLMTAFESNCHAMSLSMEIVARSTSLSWLIVLRR